MASDTPQLPLLEKLDLIPAHLAIGMIEAVLALCSRLLMGIQSELQSMLLSRGLFAAKNIQNSTANMSVVQQYGR